MIGEWTQVERVYDENLTAHDVCLFSNANTDVILFLLLSYTSILPLAFSLATFKALVLYAYVDIEEFWA